MYPKIHSFLIIIGLNRTKNKLKKGKSREKQKLIVQKRKLVLEPFFKKVKVLCKI